MKQKKHNKSETEFEDWNRFDGVRENPDDKPKKFSKPPIKYQAGFLMKLDKRTEIYQLLKTAFDEITSDVGGVDSLSHVQICLVEKFCFLEFVLRTIEQSITQTEPKKSTKLLNKWIFGLNALSGLAKTVGLERRAKKIANLRDYVNGKKR